MASPRSDLEPAWQLRPARPEDAERCAALAVAAWERIHDSYRTILGAALHDFLFPTWQGDKAAAATAVVREHPERALVATVPEGVVGFVTFRLDAEREVGEIGNNAVDPAWQGRGIAVAMYRAVLERMRGAGMCAAKVTTGWDEGHAPARAAYTRAGFRLGLPSVTYYQDLS